MFSTLGLTTWALWNVLLVVNNLPGNWLKPENIFFFISGGACSEEPWKWQDGCTSTTCAPPAKPPTFLLFTIWIKVLINEFCLPHVGDLMRVWFSRIGCSDNYCGCGYQTGPVQDSRCYIFLVATSLMRKQTWVTIVTWDYQRWIYLCLILN